MTKDEVLARLAELNCSASDALAEWLSKLLVDDPHELILAAFLPSESAATVITTRDRLVQVGLSERRELRYSCTLFLSDIESLRFSTSEQMYRQIEIHGLGGLSSTSATRSEPTMHISIMSPDKDGDSLFKFYQVLTQEFFIAKDKWR